jgi:hypothetical protein
MRKVFGGVAMHPEQLVEWYAVTLKNDDNTYETLFNEKFDRKKPYGTEYVIEKANEIFLERIELPLTEEEVSWFKSLNTIELQTEILAAGTITGDE